MLIFGLTGGIGHGKTTFGDYLTEDSKSHLHWEVSDLITEVANDLRNTSSVHPRADDIPAINNWLEMLSVIVSQRLHCNLSVDQLRLSSKRLKASPQNFTKLFKYLDAMQHNPTRQAVIITPTNKSDYRALLQWLGSYLVENCGGAWFDEIVRRLRTVTDTELAVIGGVRYPSDASALRSVGAVIVEVRRPNHNVRDLTDLTEAQRKNITADTVVMNDSGLVELQRCAHNVLLDQRSHRLKTEYFASSL